MPLAGEFGKFIAQTRYDDIPIGVRHAAKVRILDLLGAALAGYHAGRHKALLPLLDSAGDVTAWGLGRGLSLRDAILFNSFLSHSMYLEDGSRFSGGHPSSVVIPSAMAFAEKGHASGRDLITAVVVGYEVFLRLARAIYPSTLHRGFQSTSVTGAAASAAAAASVLRYPAETAQSALAIGAMFSSGLIEASTSSSSQPIQVGRACEGGAVAALFAGQGAIGATHILERGFLKAFADGASADGVLNGLGTDYCIGETYIKVHGGCRGNHAPVDLVQDMVARHNLTPAQIESIVISVDTVTDRIAIHEPINGTQAQYCISFAAAVAMLNGDASIFQYTDDTLADPGIRALMGRIRIRLDTSLDVGYPEKRSCSVEILLMDGRRFEGHLDNAKGEPEHPYAPQEIEKKFLTMSRRVLGTRSDEVKDMVMSLDALNDIGTLTAKLNAGP
jgi:2-methylcitrate dehydratase PrpD